MGAYEGSAKDDDDIGRNDGVSMKRMMMVLVGTRMMRKVMATRLTAIRMIMEATR